MKYLAATTALLIATQAFAATYAPTDAAKHIGESATVEGVASVYVSIVDIGGSGRGAPFTGVIFKGTASAVPNVTTYNTAFPST